MMSWFRPFRRSTSKSEHRAAERASGDRKPRGFAHTAVEELEPRLCLGGITAPPVGTADYSDGVGASAEVGTATAGSTIDTTSTSTLSGTTSNAGDGTVATSSGSSTPATPTTPASPADVDVFADTGGNDTGTVLVAGPSTGGSTTANPGGGQVVSGGQGTSGGAEAGPNAADSGAGAEGAVTPNDQVSNGSIPWWHAAEQDVVVKYDYRDANGYENVITDQQQQVAEEALDAWSSATGGRVVFVRDTAAGLDEIVNFGVGDLAAHGGTSTRGGTLGLGGGQLELELDGSVTVRGSAWLDSAESWDVEIGNGDQGDTVDFFTVLAHEAGHVLGLDDTHSGISRDIMNGVYTNERMPDAIQYAALNGSFYTEPQTGALLSSHVPMRPMMAGFPQLLAGEVTQLLQRASAATPSNDAIIAIVDRGGNILGVHVEAGVLANIPDRATQIFAIDGAVAKARTAAFFSNGDPNNGTLAPLTSRLVQFISQTTVTQREVQSNPNVGLATSANGGGIALGGRSAATVRNSNIYGPGTVAPVGLGGHFPPGVPFVPPVDLFEIEDTNRDSLIHPGPDGIKGTGDDVLLADRFNTAGLTTNAAIGLNPPESYGFVTQELDSAQARGIATLPGGIPIFRDTSGDGNGDTLIGGIGVFFPGTTGMADFEQNFQAGVGQTQLERLNAPKVLEAEFMALAAISGSLSAQNQFAVPGAKVGALGGIAPVANIDLPFGRLDLVGIQLSAVGPIAGVEGLRRLLQFGNDLGPGAVSGALDPGLAAMGGVSVAEGWLVNPTASADGLISAADVTNIINRGIQQAQRTRAAVRLPVSSQTRMVFAVSDRDGNILGLFRMRDATIFSIDVAVAKARNAAYYANAAELNAFDTVNGVNPGTAFTARTFRFLAEPRFPAGIDGTFPPQFSILNQPSINANTAENNGAPGLAGEFDATVNPNLATVVGYNSFFPNNNFLDPDDVTNQNGVVFFPGSTPLYNGNQLIGGFGVSGDGVDQDDVVTFVGAQGFLPPDPLRADNVFVRGVRLPYQKFLRNPEGSVTPFD